MAVEEEKAEWQTKIMEIVNDGIVVLIEEDILCDRVDHRSSSNIVISITGYCQCYIVTITHAVTRFHTVIIVVIITHRIIGTGNVIVVTAGSKTFSTIVFSST